MKKSLLLIIAYFVFMVSTARADNYIRAYAVGWIGDFEHTYSCAWGDCHAVYVNGQETSTSGGYYVTRGYASDANILGAICATGCDFQYGINGVCHQFTNRMLYYAGTILPSYIGGYALSVSWFGYYGFLSSTCFASCDFN